MHLRAPVPFDISELTGSRLLDYIPAHDVFTSSYVESIQIEDLPTLLPTFRAHVVLVLKIEGASQREKTTQKDFVDIGLMMGLAQDLKLTHGLFDVFRGRDAWKQRILPAVARWKDKKNEKAQTVVDWLIVQKAIDAAVKTAAVQLWEEYFVTLAQLIE
jgi:hypothetical protein